MLLSHYDTLEILLYQIALNEELSDARCGDFTITRLDILFRCLRATKSFFDDFYSISSHYFPFLPFSIWCQFGHAVVSLSRLSLFQSEDGWDLDYVQSTIDFDQTIDRMMHKLDEAQIFAEQSSGPMSLADLPEIFGRLSNRMQLMKESHQQKKESLEKAQLQGAEPPPNFDFLFNISFNTLFQFEEYSFLDHGVEMSQDF